MELLGFKFTLYIVNKCSNKSSLGPSEDAKSPLVSSKIQQLPWQLPGIVLPWQGSWRFNPSKAWRSSRNPRVVPFRSLPAEDSNWRSDFWQGKSGGTWHLGKSRNLGRRRSWFEWVQWRFGAFLELGFFRGKNWGEGLKPVDKDSYSQVWLVFLVKVDHLPARQQGGSFKMSVLVPTFLAALFLGCQNAKRFRKRSIFERQGWRMLLFWRISMAGIFLVGKQKRQFFLWWNRFSKSWGICCWFSFPHVYAVDGEKREWWESCGRCVISCARKSKDSGTACCSCSLSRWLAGSSSC